ncbi:MAG TPA: hemolysin family protein [Paludibacteraceae bacterium]|mgnify:CR=1 FL=1|nr:hemolysin family protein [Paludibacteraceae bacterium]HQF50843.1 hemolysin family protein [Paludibacteraceae bacterium]HQJ89856.1 hemolysin family protein [Paludibacteraceae bacterium]
MVLLLIYLCTALLVSFLCSLMESVLLSSSASYIETISTKSKGGMIMKQLKSDVDKSIAAILALNTLANTIGAAGVGAQAVVVFGNEYFGIASIVLTLLILIFTEIIPKSIGANHWRSLAPNISYLIKGTTYIAYPFVILSRIITKMITNKNAQTISREELVALTYMGEKEGVFESNESKIISNLIKLTSTKVRSIMTPRTVVLAAQEDLTLEKFFNNKEFLRYSRIPIYTNTIDNITGFVLKSDILLRLANEQKSTRLKEIRRPIIVCYENTSIPKFYDLMISKKELIALVIDEYGGMEGIVTMEDVVETILGLEITDESDVQIDMQQFAKERWRKKSQNMDFAQDETQDSSSKEQTKE